MSRITKLWAPYFLDYFESELFYRDGPFIISVSFVETQKTCYIFKIGEQSLQLCEGINRVSAYAVYLHYFDEQEILDIHLWTHSIHTGLSGRSRAFRLKCDLSQVTYTKRTIPLDTDFWEPQMIWIFNHNSFPKDPLEKTCWTFFWHSVFTSSRGTLII